MFLMKHYEFITSQLTQQFPQPSLTSTLERVFSEITMGTFPSFSHSWRQKGTALRRDATFETHLALLTSVIFSCVLWHLPATNTAVEDSQIYVLMN